MKQCIKSGTIYALISLLLISAFVQITYAEEAPKQIQLDLSKSPLQPKQEGDLLNEKYEEVMREISISEEAAMVVDNIKQAVEKVRDLSAEVLISQVRGQRNETVIFHLSGSMENKVARLEFLEPSSLRGMISVADQASMELRIFQPVINMITVQTLEDASKEALSALNVAQVTTELTSYFDFSLYHVEVLDVEELDGVSDYLLEVDAPDEQVWQVRVKDDSWIPHEIIVYEEGTLLGKMCLSEVVLNQDLSLELLTELPDVKEERI